MRDDERTIRRLEAFSDIVIAFSLAEVGLGLAVPNSLTQLRESWINLAAFAFSFTLISIVWWYHHKLFATYISLKPVTVALNFVMLGSVALGVYFQQTTIHFVALNIDSLIPLHIWLACMAAIFGCLAAMYSVGIWEHRESLERSAIHWGMSLTYQTAVSALGLAALAVAFPNSPRAFIIVIVIVAIAGAFHEQVATYTVKSAIPSREAPDPGRKRY